MAGISHKMNAEWKDEKPFYMVPKDTLTQRSNVRKDTFDNDPDTASMYDDGWVYSKPGKFQRGDPMAGISHKMNAEWKDEKPFYMVPKDTLTQRSNVRKDTFDNDPDTAGMYDDGWVYSKPGKFQRGDPMAGISHKMNAEWKDEKPFYMVPADTLAQEEASVQESWPSVARCADGKTSTDFEACDHNNNQEH
jgi:hypothetical protein